jgi:hypothetical protein
MNEPAGNRRSDAVPDIASSSGFGSVGSEQWLGGEAMVGPGYRRSGGEHRSREWSNREALVLILAGLTVGTALGMLVGRRGKR